MDYDIVKNGKYGWKATFDGKTIYAYKKEDVKNSMDAYIRDLYSPKVSKERLRNDEVVANAPKKPLPPHLQVIADKINSFDKGYSVVEITSDQIFR